MGCHCSFIPLWGADAPLLHPDVVFWTIVLAGVLLLAGFILAAVDRWRKRQMSDVSADTDQVMSFRAMYERGELSKEEYERILHRVGERIRNKETSAPVTSSLQPPVDLAKEEFLER